MEYLATGLMPRCAFTYVRASATCRRPK